MRFRADILNIKPNVYIFHYLKLSRAHMSASYHSAIILVRGSPKEVQGLLMSNGDPALQIGR